MKKSIKSFVMVTILGLIGKVLGLYRSLLFARQFGTTAETDAFVIALTGILILSSLFSWTMNSAVVMVITDIKDKDKKINVVNNIFNIFMILSILLSVIIYFASPIFVKILASGFDGNQFDFTDRLFKIGVPALCFYVAQGIFRGFLNTESSFMDYGLLPFAQNIPVILYLIVWSDKYGVVGMMVAQVIGIASQMLIQIPFLKKSGYRVEKTFDTKASYLKQLLIYLGPIMMGVIINELNSIVDKTIASMLPASRITVLDYGMRLISVFLDAIISPIGLVLFPILALAFTEAEFGRFKRTYKDTFNATFLLVIPLSFVLTIYSKELVSLFYGGGKFDQESIEMTSKAMLYYGLGFVPMAGKVLMNRIFLSTNDAKAPMKDGIITLLLNLTLNLIFVMRYDYIGLALATSITNWLTFLRLAYLIRKKMKIGGFKDELFFYFRITAVIGVLAVISRKVFATFNFYMLTTGYKILYLILTIAVTGLLYLAIIYLIDRKRINDLISLIKNKA